MTGPSAAMPARNIDLAVLGFQAGALLCVVGFLSCYPPHPVLVGQDSRPMTRSRSLVPRQSPDALEADSAGTEQFRSRCYPNPLAMPTWEWLFAGHLGSDMPSMMIHETTTSTFHSTSTTRFFQLAQLATPFSTCSLSWIHLQVGGPDQNTPSSSTTCAPEPP